MSFSFADLGFWWLAALSLALELLHLILEAHWPAIRGSRLGPRTTAAKTYMLIEFVALVGALAAAIGSVTRMGKAVPRPSGQIAATVLAGLGLLGMFFFVWQR